MKLEKKGILKVFKVGSLIIIGVCLVIGFTEVLFEGIINGGLLSSAIEDNSIKDPSEPSMTMDVNSITLKDNEEKEIEFELNNIEEWEITTDISDDSVASSIIEDDKILVKPLAKGTTIVDFVSKEDEEEVLAQLVITVDESKETKEKKKTEKNVLGQIAIKQKNNIYF